jgi:AcrR family transcriptional regulator
LVTRAQPYHHANLHQTLLDAAIALIGEVGPRAFTLREVARRAGVSHNAPYRHFAGKDQLLAAVAAEGFDRLTAVMQKAMARGTSPRQRLVLCGCGYVDFALRWPQHFVAMFDLPHAPNDCAPAHVAGQNAFQVLLDAVTAAQHAGDLPAGEVMPLAWTAWSLVHGIAKLATSGNLPLTARATLEFTRRATEAMFGPAAAADSSQKMRK